MGRTITWLYDIFERSAEAPTDGDGFLKGLVTAPTQADREPIQPASERVGHLWETQVVARIVDAGYPSAMVRTVRGRVQQTLPGSAPERIALLRLDTDYFDSTLHELEHLYPRLAPGGVLLVDDFGRLDGATQAARQYFARHAAPPMLHRIGPQGCVAIKGPEA